MLRKYIQKNFMKQNKQMPLDLISVPEQWVNILLRFYRFKNV